MPGMIGLIGLENNLQLFFKLLELFLQSLFIVLPHSCVTTMLMGTMTSVEVGFTENG